MPAELKDHGEIMLKDAPAQVEDTVVAEFEGVRIYARRNPHGPPTLNGFHRERGPTERIAERLHALGYGVKLERFTLDAVHHHDFEAVWLARGTRHRSRSPEHRAGRGGAAEKHGIFPSSPGTRGRIMSVDIAQTREIIRPHRAKPLADVEAAILEAGLARARSGARCASTTAAGPCTPPTARTTARCPSASSSPGTPTTSRRPSRACRRFGAPILGRGGGTSLAGQCCNVAVVMDFSKYMNQVLEIDPQRRLARVQPGASSTSSARQAEEHHHLTFGPDPSTHNHCCIGGMLGNNSCGIHSLLAGRTVDNVEELEVLTYDGTRLRVGPTDDAELERIIAAGGRRGEIYAALRDLRDRYADQIRARFPKIPRRVSGYNLDELLPENGFHVARALVGIGGHLRPDPGGDPPPRAQPAEADAGGPRVSPTWPSRAITSLRSPSTGRSAWRASTIACSRT